MPITSQWANAEKTIIYFVYDPPWNAQEFQAAVFQVNSLLDTVNHPVDMIIHMRGGMPNLGNSWPFRSVMRNFHRNVRYTALVGANDFLRRTISAFMRVMGQQNRPFFFAATLEEAHQRLAERNKVATAQK